MLYLILQAFYFILPAYLANMAPVIFDKLSWLKFLDRPIDTGKKIGHNFLFGPNKTWRGLVAGIIISILVSFIQAELFRFDFFQGISRFHYPSHWLVFGFLAGSGALIGDLTKSFIKRRLGIKSGLSWPVFDQLDFVAGFFLFTYWLAEPSLAVIFAAAVMTLVLHPLTNLAAYFLKIKKVWW